MLNYRLTAPGIAFTLTVRPGQNVEALAQSTLASLGYAGTPFTLGEA